MSEGVDLDKFVASFPALVEAEGGLPRIKRLVIALGVYGHLSPRVAEPDDSMAELSDSSLAARRLPPGWHWRRLDEVADYNTGSRVEPTAIEPTAWLLELEDIEKDSSRLIARTTAGERSPKSTKSRFGKGDILYGKLRPYLDKVLVADADGYCTTELAPVRPGPLMTSEFLRYVMKSPDFITYASSKTYGMNLPRLATRDAEAWSVPVPPLVEQQRIVAKVDELMRLIDDLEAKQARKREVQARLRTSALDALTKAEGPEELATAWKRVEDNFEVLFERAEGVAGLRDALLRLAVTGALSPQHGTRQSYRQVPLGDVVESRLGKMLDKAKNKGVPLPYLRNTNVHWFSIRVDDIKLMPFEETEVAEFELRDGDVMVCEGGHGIGRSAVWRGQVTPMMFQKALHRLRPSSTLNSDFLCFQIKVAADSGRLEGLYTGMGIPHLTGRSLARLEVAVPPLAEQQRIVAKVDALMKICDDLEARLRAKEATAKRLVEAVVAEWRPE